MELTLSGHGSGTFAENEVKVKKESTGSLSQTSFQWKLQLTLCSVQNVFTICNSLLSPQRIRLSLPLDIHLG